jgi:hypothetical protein
MISRLMVAALCVLGPFTYAAHSGNVNGEATYISFSVPGALGTYPVSINASMEVTGYYDLSPTVSRGFLREADGSITTFDVPGAVATEPQGINAAGNITGFYNDRAAASQGFLRYADGRIITFAGNPAIYLGLLPISINDFDEIAGNYTYTFSQTVFTRSRAGVFTTIQVPDRGSIEVTAINASGSVVGYTGYSANGYTGFVAHPDGYWAEIVIPTNPDCPNEAPGAINAAATIPGGINAAGTIAGVYTNNFTDGPRCKTNITGGFVISADGEVALFQPPGTIPPMSSNLGEPGDTPGPSWISIDQAGDITGSYWDTAGILHGFVRNAYGTISSFDPPEGKETRVTSINDGGAIAGYYHYNAGGEPPVGFIRVP